MVKTQLVENFKNEHYPYKTRYSIIPSFHYSINLFWFTALGDISSKFYSISVDFDGKNLSPWAAV